MPSPYPPLNDPVWLRAEYLERGCTAADIAAEVGCPHGTVDRALRRHGIRRPPHRTLAAIPAEWLREQYVERGRSISDIAGEVRLSSTSVHRALVEAGVAIDARRSPVELEDPAWLSAQEGVTKTELARQLGVTAQVVFRARRRHGLRTGVRRASKYPELDDRTWLEERYVARGMTQAQLAAEIGCSSSAVGLAMDRLGIRARPRRVPDYPQLHDRHWLAEQAWQRGHEHLHATQLGCHPTSVADAIRKHGLR